MPLVCYDTWGPHDKTKIGLCMEVLLRSLKNLKVNPSGKPVELENYALVNHNAASNACIFYLDCYQMSGRHEEGHKQDAEVGLK